MAPMTRQADLIVIVSNAPDMLLAKRIAHVLVEEGLAACVNLGAAGLSIYGWEGRLEGAQEVGLTIKTTADRQDAAIDRLLALHPYDVPEVLVLPVIASTLQYGAWVRAQTRRPMPEPRDDADNADSG